MAKYTVSNYPRDNLSPKTAGMLDALAANPATANIGVNSGYRDVGKNQKAGGAKKSQHIHGNAVDLDISGLSPAQKKEALDTAVAAGAKGIGIYSSGNSLHIDPRANPTVWGPSPRGKYRGLLKKEWSLIPDWARPTLDAVFGGINPQPNPDLPETVSLPAARPQFAPALPAAPISPVTRAALQAPTFSAPLGVVERAPLGPVSRAPVAPPSSFPARPSGPLNSMPSPALQSSFPARPAGPMGSLPARPSNLDAAPVSAVTRGPALAPATRPAPEARPSNITAAPVGMVTRAPLGPVARPASVTMNPNTLDKVKDDAVSITPALPSAVPALATPPASVLAPALAPPVNVPQQVVAPIAPPPAAPRSRSPYVGPPAAPQYTASDIYGGQIGSALDNTGTNTVSRDANGITSVTNKYGVTTATMPDGKQAAYGSLPGISGPTASKIGGAVKGALPGVAGSALGGLLAGPVGALIGAAIAKSVTQPGGLLNRQSFDTAAFGKINAAKPTSGGAFPGAPSGGYTGSASHSNRSAEGMRGISPGAAGAISRGQGGLY